MKSQDEYYFPLLSEHVSCRHDVSEPFLGLLLSGYKGLV